MPMTHDLGSFFVHRVALEPNTPVFHRAPTNEIEEPFRRSNSVVVRLFRRTGLVFGRWRHVNRTEDEALLAALRLGAYGGHEQDDALALISPEVEDEDRGQGAEPGGRVADAGNARPTVIHYG